MAVIDQLIASQYQRSAGPSPTQTLAGIQGLQGQKLNNQARQQNLSMNEQAMEQEKRKRGLQFAANIGQQLRNERDPQRRAQQYATARYLAQKQGYDVAELPEQYNEQAQMMLDVAPTLLSRGPGTAPASVVDRNDLIDRLPTNPDGSLKSPEQMTAAERAIAVEAGLIPRAMGSAAQTIADRGTATEVADVEGTIAGERSRASEVGKVEGQRQADKAGLEADIAGAKEAGKTTEQRRTQRIEAGVEAAKSIPTLRRTLDLLERVETGGPEAVSLAIKQRLGLESADEGELSNKLGKAVLSQLRDTFGAQFTVEEGKRLENIEANFGKNTTTNKRLIGQLLEMSKRKAQQGIEDAVAVGDYQTAAAIKNSMGSALGDDMGIFGAQQTQAPPIQGARQAPDGNWYVERDGQFFRVEQ